MASTNRFRARAKRASKAGDVRERLSTNVTAICILEVRKRETFGGREVERRGRAELPRAVVPAAARSDQWIDDDKRGAGFNAV